VLLSFLHPPLTFYPCPVLIPLLSPLFCRFRRVKITEDFPSYSLKFVPFFVPSLYTLVVRELITLVFTRRALPSDAPPGSPIFFPFRLSSSGGSSQSLVRVFPPQFSPRTFLCCLSSLFRPSSLAASFTDLAQRNPLNSTSGSPPVFYFVPFYPAMVFTVPFFDLSTSVLIPLRAPCQAYLFLVYPSPPPPTPESHNMRLSLCLFACPLLLLTPASQHLPFVAGFLEREVFR